MKRRDFLRCAAGISATSLLGGCATVANEMARSGSGRRPNILFITADDMSYDSLGVTGCAIPGISPNLDGLAHEGLLLQHCHIVTPICGPSRYAFITGALPQQSGQMGHYNMPPLWFGESPIRTNVAELLRTQGGYYTGVMCKVPDNRGWDWLKTHVELGLGRDPSKFYQFTRAFVDEAVARRKPFFLHANSMDPHEYWARQKYETRAWRDAMMGRKEYDTYPNGKPYPDPAVAYRPEEVPVPPCWPDHDAIREEIHTYYNSVKRLDDTVGAILKALRESGQDRNTLVLFISDHGIGKAFAKWSLYPLGTRTPLIVRWPGVTAPGRRDAHNVVSTIDLAPTFLEMAGLRALPTMHGVSLVPILSGDPQAAPRETAFTCFNYMNNTPDRDRQDAVFSADIADHNDNYRPMRAINSRRYTYIWNGWADGRREIPLEMSSSQAIRRILTATGHAVRADFEKFRTPEEFYDTVADPGCLHNLMAASDQQQRIARSRQRLLEVMTRTDDHELARFRQVAVR